MPHIQPESDGKFWLELFVSGRYIAGVKLEVSSSAARFILGERSQEGFLALRERVKQTSAPFADYIRPDIRLELRSDMAIAYA